MRTLLLSALLALGTPALAQQRSHPAPLQPARVAQEAPRVTTTAPGSVLVIYDVADLIDQGAVDAGEARLLNGGVAGTADDVLGAVAEQEQRRQRSRRALDDLVTLIEAYCDPAFDTSPGQVLPLDGGRLVIHAIPEQQQWIERFLTAQRTDDGQFMIFSWVHTAGFGELAPLFDGGEPRVHADMHEQQQLSAELAGRGAEMISSPVLLVLSRQRSNVRIMNPVSHVVDWELHTVQPGSRLIADPVIDVVQEGISVDARAVPLPDDRYGLTVTLTWSSLDRPVEVRKLSLHEDLDDVEISLPRVHTVTVSADLVVPLGGGAALLGSAALPDKDVVVSLLLDKVVVESPGSAGAGPDAEPGGRRRR